MKERKIKEGREREKEKVRGKKEGSEENFKCFKTWRRERKARGEVEGERRS